jgi:DNA-binding transcriptional ArsR family regulator
MPPSNLNDFNNSNKNRENFFPDRLSIIKTLSSKNRLQILFLLFIYQEMSLTDLSNHLNLTKNTIIYHMKRLAANDLINVFDRPLPNSIKPEKCYRVNSDFYQKMFTPFDKMEDFNEEEILDYSAQIFHWNVLLFESVREFLKELQEFYRTNKKKINDPKSALKIHQEIYTPRDLIPLSKKGFREYMKNYHILMEKTKKMLQKENQKKNSIIRPYLAFNMVLPIKKIFEYKQTEE